jgi:hypothetical protein
VCNRYETPEVWEIERYWHVGRRTPSGCAAWRRCTQAHMSARGKAVACCSRLFNGG